MDDYIRREDAVGEVEFGITLASAINIVTGERTELFQRENDELRDAVKRIEALPAADVVPVVRCRDCKYWDNGNLSFECPWDYGRHGSSDEDDFCSYGERREE